MKRLTLGILLVSLISLASYAQQVMYVWEGGQYTPFSIETVDSITFVDTTATVVTRPDDTKRNLTYLFDIESVPEVCITLTARDWNTYLGNFDKWEHNGLYVHNSLSPKTDSPTTAIVWDYVLGGTPHAAALKVIMVICTTMEHSGIMSISE